MEINLENSPRAVAAMKYFKEGYNCAQSVVLAYADCFDADPKLLLSMSSSLGGGMGRLREVCGAVSGMFLVAGAVYGYDDPRAFEEKKVHYERIQQLAAEFKSDQGSIVCRELLGLSSGADKPTPEKRTEEYYKKRPCEQLVGMAAAIMEKYMENNQ